MTDNSYNSIGSKHDHWYSIVDKGSRITDPVYEFINDMLKPST